MTAKLALLCTICVFNIGSLVAQPTPATGKDQNGKTQFVPGQSELYLECSKMDATYNGFKDQVDCCQENQCKNACNMTFSGLTLADEFQNSYCNYWSDTVTIPQAQECPDKPVKGEKLPAYCEAATENPKFEIKQTLLFGGITLDQFNEKKDKFQAAIAETLAVPKGDVKINGASLKRRRRSLLATKVQVDSSVVAASKEEATARRTKMASSDYETKLQKNAKKQTQISTLTAEAEPPAEVSEIPELSPATRPLAGLLALLLVTVSSLMMS